MKEQDQFNFTFSTEKWANGGQSADKNTIQYHQRQSSIVSDSHVNVSNLLNSAQATQKRKEENLAGVVASSVGINNNYYSQTISPPTMNFVGGPKDYQNFLHMQFSAQSTPTATAAYKQYHPEDATIEEFKTPEGVRRIANQAAYSNISRQLHLQ